MTPVATERGLDGRELRRAVARIQAGVLALTCGILGGLGLFLMTVWLVIKGGPEVGPHLGLLGQYLVGYSVTWVGSVIGLAYGLVVGGVAGWSVATLYNTIAQFRSGLKRDAVANHETR